MKITEKKLDAWRQEGNYDNLIVALKEGMFNMRKIAADFLGEFENETVISALIDAVNDKATNVSDAAIQSLNSFNLSDE
jgi:HEAT repeat protein